MPLGAATTEERSVVFAAATRIYPVKHLADFTDAEIAAVWITPEENKRRLEDVSKNIQAMRNNVAEDDSQGLCFRGLEMLKSGSILRANKINAEKHIDTVLNEQEQQWERAQINYERIAKVSETSSSQARQHAATKGLRDRSETCLYISS